LDKSQWTEKYSGATYLSSHQIPVLIDDKHAIAHNKVMIIDGNTLITGSFNRKGNRKECGGKRVWLVGSGRVRIGDSVMLVMDSVRGFSI
jgi:hypothetical protein